MRRIETSAYEIATRFLGLTEVPGKDSNPAVLAMLQLDNSWVAGDDVPWCSAFTNYPFFVLGLPRSESLAARSWLTVGNPILLEEAEPGFDVVVFKRGTDHGPEILKAPGHVGFYSGHNDKVVFCLGGNQADKVTIASFPIERLLSVRRIV